ncbi:MarR family winged helix-turn-helix transcriptional regulator [Sphingomonas sp. DT-207]|uniref:MarR family winged helix-turn-helix transcriptional regulator n=1 Tax=Sphingomonas sp. DT-207 TaxID=3396167 RepID=UPI003F5402D9
MYMHQDSPLPCICTSIRKTARVVARAYDEALAPHGMTTAQFAILRHVIRGEPLALSRLAEELVMDRSSLYRALTPMETRGWVQVEPGKGRAKLARLTDAGRAALAEATPAWNAIQGRLEQGMDRDFWVGLGRALSFVARVAEDRAPGKGAAR